MKKIVSLLMLCFGLSLYAQNTQLTGTLSPPGSSQAAFTGFLYLNLSQSASVLLTCQTGSTLALPNTQVVIPIINGAMQNPPAVWGADCLNPRVPYNVIIRDANGNTLVTSQWLIQGSLFNIGTAPQVNAATPKFCGGLFVCNNISNVLLGEQFITAINNTSPLLVFSNQVFTQLSDINALGQYEAPNSSGCPINIANQGALAWDTDAQEYCNYTSIGWQHLVGSTITIPASAAVLGSDSASNVTSVATLGDSTTGKLIFATGTPLSNTYVDGGTFAWTSLPFQQLTTTGSNCAAATLDISGVLNIPRCSGGGGGSTPSTTGLAFWDNTGGAWGTSYTTSGTGTVLVLSNSPTITTPTFAGGAAFSGANNGNISLTTTGTPPSSAAANTVLLTVPNSVTAYTMTIPGTVPGAAGSVASTDTSGTQSWALLPKTPTVAAGSFLNGYNATTGLFTSALFTPTFTGQFSFLGTGPTSNTTTTVALANTDTTMTVASTTGYPTSGYALVGTNNFNGELISWTGITATTFTGLTRSLFGTTAPSSNAIGASVILVSSVSSDSTAVSPKSISFWHGPLVMFPDTGLLSGSCCTGPGVIMGTSLTMDNQTINWAGGGAVYGTANGIGFRNNDTSIAAMIDGGVIATSLGNIIVGAATTSISPTKSISYLTGTAPTALATIVVPSTSACSTSGITCSLQFLTEVGVVLTNTGNIAAALTKTAGQLLTCTLDTIVTKWMCN